VFDQETILRRQGCNRYGAQYAVGREYECLDAGLVQDGFKRFYQPVIQWASVSQVVVGTRRLMGPPNPFTLARDDFTVDIDGKRAQITGQTHEQFGPVFKN
jgi:hypothetical protein